MASEKKPLPSPAMESRAVQESEAGKVKELPQVGIPENTVVIGGKLVEIKPTKLKYQRNKTALFYRIMETYPLPDILAMGAGSFGDKRDGDKAVMDFLIAATDDEE